MALRGLKTLHLRMSAASASAVAIASHLEAHPLVERVIFPGLRSHPQYELAARQQKGPGAMITFYVRGGLAEANRFLESLSVFTLAESLGAVERCVRRCAARLRFVRSRGSSEAGRRMRARFQC